MELVFIVFGSLESCWAISFPLPSFDIGLHLADSALFLRNLLAHSAHGVLVYLPCSNIPTALYSVNCRTWALFHMLV